MSLCQSGVKIAAIYVRFLCPKKKDEPLPNFHMNLKIILDTDTKNPINFRIITIEENVHFNCNYGFTDFALPNDVKNLGIGVRLILWDPSCDVMIEIAKNPKNGMLKVHGEVLSKASEVLRKMIGDMANQVQIINLSGHRPDHVAWLIEQIYKQQTGFIFKLDPRKWYLATSAHCSLFIVAKKLGLVSLVDEMRTYLAALLPCSESNEFFSNTFRCAAKAKDLELTEICFNLLYG